jgi:hypothetical protein
MAALNTVLILMIQDNSRYDGDLFLSVYGVNYKIRRDMKVPLPPYVSHVLDHSPMLDELTAAHSAPAYNLLAEP